MDVMNPMHLRGVSFCVVYEASAPLLGLDVKIHVPYDPENWQSV